MVMVMMTLLYSGRPVSVFICSIPTWLLRPVNTSPLVYKSVSSIQQYPVFPILFMYTEGF